MIQGGGGHGSHFRGCLLPPDLLQCFRTGRVFGIGDVKARLPVTEDLEGMGLPQYGKDFPQLTSRIREDLCFTRTLRGRQDGGCSAHFQVCKPRLREAKVWDSALQGGRHC